MDETPYLRLRRIFDYQRTGMLALGVVDACTCEGCGTDPHMIRLREVWAMARHEFCRGIFSVYLNGQVRVRVHAWVCA